jgi:hypothetical protein
MSQSKYTFFSDPGHGWAKVKRSELASLGIADKISGYSYQRGEFVYLEEDCDLSTFVSAKNQLDQHVEFKGSTCRFKQSKIRSYDRYQAVTA